MAKTIAVINQKGGVGKTTTSVNLGAYLAKLGRKVLLVDFDPQGNATSGLGFDKDALEFTSYDAITLPDKVAGSIIKTKTPNLSLLPSNSGLSGAEIELADQEGREFKLKQALSDIETDYILIDCPPALGLLTINALTAADSLLIPVQAEYYALEGLGQLLRLIQRARETIHPNLLILGIVLTMFDRRTSLAEQVQKELKEHFDELLFDTVVPRNIRLAEAPSFGRSIAEHDKWSKGARAYKQLAKEVDFRAQKAG